MKIQELFEESLQHYVKRLIKTFKIKKLGGGAFGQVFQHPQFRNVVTKVYYTKDLPYVKYVKWCMNNQDNPYVPKIIEQVEHQTAADGENYNILFLEKLKPFRTSGGMAFKMSKIFDYQDKETEENAFNEFDEYIDTQNNPSLFDYIDFLVKKHRPNKSFATWWNHVKTYDKSRFDLHYNNAMLRGDQIVFTDPVASDISFLIVLPSPDSRRLTFPNIHLI